MTGRMARRLWSEDAACGFCLRAEPGGVWCTGICHDLSLSEAVKRVRAVHANVVRLEVAQHAVVKAVTPHVVPCSPTTPFDRVACRRSSGVEHVIDSLQRYQKSITIAEATARRLRVTREALAETRALLAKNRGSFLSLK